MWSPQTTLRRSCLAYIPSVAQHDVRESLAKRITINLGEHRRHDWGYTTVEVEVLP
jgi:hypothetical protein